MLFGLFFAFWRFLQIVTLIPTLGMLAYFVHQYVKANALTPNSILVLFIVSVLAAVWAIYTLFTYHRSRSNAYFVSFIDLCFVGALIAGVYELRGISHDNCSSITTSSYTTVGFGILGSVTYGGLGLNVNKTCSMLKACWVFGIMNCIMFFFTSFSAMIVGRRHVRDRKGKEVYVKETHVSRHGHRGGSQRSYRSAQSGRRSAYV
ncbi:MAG: hypothetical protein M1818_008196 [Claussenomyces sp. TS43310]|nr:MAG: hypothetical protein M1818_008196 [Claussenomyces sp. TS43310]